MIFKPDPLAFSVCYIPHHVRVSSGRDTSPQLVVPHFDPQKASNCSVAQPSKWLVVIPTAHEERLREVEADASHGAALMLLELVDQRPDPGSLSQI